MTSSKSAWPSDLAATTTIRPIHGWTALNLREVWRYRELLYFLIWRDVKVRYKQTVLGIAWAFIQPFASMVVFSVIFGTLVKVPSDGIPYPIFNFAALVPWTFFASGLSRASGSLVGSANLITKVYFPRLVIPIASATSELVDFAVAFVVLLGMMLTFGIVPTINALWLPLLVFLALLTALGTGLWLSALNVQFRDVRYALPFLIQLWFYATPVVYPSSLLPEPWRTLSGLNPMAGVIEGFRWALLGIKRAGFLGQLGTADLLGLRWAALSTPAAPGALILVSTITALILLFSGALYFRRMEKTFADVV